jgi:hypothetical protein
MFHVKIGGAVRKNAILQNNPMHQEEFVFWIQRHDISHERQRSDRERAVWRADSTGWAPREPLY